MKKSFKKLLAVLLALCMCASVMVGCAPQDAAEDTKSAGNTKPADTEGTEPV